MTSSSLVTIYIVNHNYGRYLEECISSVFNQTYKFIEIILIDDGSSDVESKVLMEKYESDPRIFTIRQKNLGLTASNNTAINNSTGEYIMRLDADDYLQNNCVSELVEVLDSNKDLALVFPDYFEISENGAILNRIERLDFESEVDLFDIPAHGACTLFRRDILLSVGGYDEEYKIQDCWDIWLKLIPNYKVTNIRKPLFFYRQHSKSLTKDESLKLQTRASIIKKHVNRGIDKSGKVIAILPVRGLGYDDINYSMMKLADKELIRWTIDEALNTDSIDELIITTLDNSLIKFLSGIYRNATKVTFILRDHRNPSILNQDIDELALGIVSKRPDVEIIVLLNQESPFRTALYIEKAINTSLLFKLDTVIAARQDDDIFFIHDGKSLVNRRPDIKTKKERDDLFRKVGGLMVIRSDYLMSNSNLFSGRVGHVILDQKSAFTIRTKFDWQIAKLLVQ